SAALKEPRILARITATVQPGFLGDCLFSKRVKHAALLSVCSDDGGMVPQVRAVFLPLTWATIAGFLPTPAAGSADTPRYTPPRRSPQPSTGWQDTFAPGRYALGSSGSAH